MFRFGCDVCLVLGPGYQRPFINWIGVATVVAYMVALILLLYDFVTALAYELREPLPHVAFCFFVFFLLVFVRVFP